MQPVRFLFAPSYNGGQLRGQFAAAGGRQSLRKRRANQPDPERSFSYLKECCAGAKSKREPPVPGEGPERSEAAPSPPSPSHAGCWSTCRRTSRPSTPVATPTGNDYARTCRLPLPVYPADSCRRDGADRRRTDGADRRRRKVRGRGGSGFQPYLTLGLAAKGTGDPSQRVGESDRPG